MDLRHVCYLVAEALKLSGGTLLGEDPGVVDARVALASEDAGTVLLTVESREYEVVVCERKRRADPPAGIEYRKARLPRPFRHGAIEIYSLEFALGRQAPAATVVHVRGECGGGVSFAGCFAISEGRDVPTHDLRAFGTPLDLSELAVAIDLLLGGSEPAVRDEIRRICE
jgi:hypothetical protein